MVFGKVVGAVVDSASPVEVELVLIYSVAEPEVTHVEGLGAFEADVGMKNAVRSGVVGFERRAVCWLWVTHFLKGGNHGDSFLGVQE